MTSTRCIGCKQVTDSYDVYVKLNGVRGEFTVCAMRPDCLAKARKAVKEGKSDD